MLDTGYSLLVARQGMMVDITLFPLRKGGLRGLFETGCKIRDTGYWILFEIWILRFVIYKNW